MIFAGPLGQAQSLMAFKDVYQGTTLLEEIVKFYQLLNDQPVQRKKSILGGLFLLEYAYHIFNSQTIVKLSVQLIHFAFHMLL